MNPEPQSQQQQVSMSRNLPPGVQDIFISYNVYGRPHVMMTLQEKPRRRLMSFGLSLLVFGPVIIGLVTACMVLQHFYVAYGFAAGILSIVTGCLSVWASKSNNACAIRAVMALAIQTMVWSIILAVAAIVIAAVVEDRTVATVVLEAILALIGIICGIMCLVVTVFFCKITCSVNYCTTVGGTAAVCSPYTGQQVIIQGPPPYSAAQQMPAVYPAQYPQQQQQQNATSSLPPSYDNLATDYKDKV